MHPTIHSTQVVTPFGSGYVPEAHNVDLALQNARTRAGGRLAIALTIALFAVTTAAAIAASSRECAPTPKLWHQNPPSNLMKLPGSVSFDDMLF